LYFGAIGIVCAAKHIRWEKLFDPMLRSNSLLAEPNCRFGKMNRLIRIKLLTLLTLIFATACNSVQTGQQQAPNPAPDVATVYLYRTHDSPGAAVGVDIKDNGIDLGTLQDGTYFIYHANAGRHVFTATTDTTSTQEIRLQAGATYYVQARVVRNQDLFQPSLTVVFGLQGQAAVYNLKRLHYHE
jgi:Protein of unknown function (DUF2846)